MPKRIFGLRTEAVAERKGKLYNEEHCNLCSISNIVILIMGALTCNTIKITHSTKLCLINQVFMLSSQKFAYLFNNV
jgi:hypothetical protein